MKCQRCRAAEATVHLTESAGGKLREVHICAACAGKAGIPTHQPPPELSLDAVLQKLIQTHVGELVGELARRVCPECRLRYMEFRINGRLGCPADYEAFREGLLPLVKRVQGATRHTGKVPARARVAASPRLRLRARLKDAVAREDYEAAAQLRDQLREGEPQS